MHNYECALRRKCLLKQIGNDGIAVITSAKQHVRSASECYPYRQNSDFYYLTEFTEPNAVAVFVPGRKEGEFLLFNTEHDPVAELWHGQRAGQDGACAQFGADQSFPIDSLDAMMLDLIAGRKKIYFNIGHDHDFDARVFEWVNKVKE